MKRGWIIGLVSLLSLNFVSALGFGGLGNFGFGGLFSSFNIELYLDALLFITIFAVINFSLEKSIFRENRTVSFVISLCVSSFAMYGLLSTGFSIQEILFSLGLTQDILPTLLWMIGIAISLFLIIKFKLRGFFAILFGLLGTFLIVYSLIADVYNQGAGIALGILFLIIALYLHKKGPGKMYQYGKTLGRGIGRTGKFLNDHGSFRIFLKKEKRIIHKIKKLEKKYQRAINNNDMKEAKSYADQVEYLKIRLQRVKANEVQAERERKETGRRNKMKELQRIDYLKENERQQEKALEKQRNGEERRRLAEEREFKRRKEDEFAKERELQKKIERQKLRKKNFRKARGKRI